MSTGLLMLTCSVSIAVSVSAVVSSIVPVVPVVLSRHARVLPHKEQPVMADVRQRHRRATECRAGDMDTPAEPGAAPCPSVPLPLGVQALRVLSLSP